MKSPRANRERPPSRETSAVFLLRTGKLNPIVGVSLAGRRRLDSYTNSLSRPRMLGFERISPRVALRKFLHGFGLRLALLSVAALLIAQLGATAHAYSHSAADSSTHQSCSTGPTRTSSHDPCNDCLAYAPLLSAAAAPGPLPSLESHGRSVAQPVAASSFVDLSLRLAFRSRAPPFTA